MLERAVAIDDTLASAHLYLGFLSWLLDWDLPAAEREFRRAIELSPSDAEAHIGYSVFLSGLTRYSEAVAECDYGLRIGVVLGPVTGWIRSDALLTIAPFFGATALLVILFEGGLELEILHVLRHAPRAAIFAALVFALSLVGVTTVAHFFAGLPWLPALMLGAILGATSPAIALPVVSGLSVPAEVKTFVKLEAVVGEVLLIVTVVLLIQSHETGTTGAADSPTCTIPVWPMPCPTVLAPRAFREEGATEPRNRLH